MGHIVVGSGGGVPEMFMTSAPTIGCPALSWTVTTTRANDGKNRSCVTSPPDRSTTFAANDVTFSWPAALAGSWICTPYTPGAAFTEKAPSGPAWLLAPAPELL